MSSHGHGGQAEHRRLAAILVSDVLGYCELDGTGEWSCSILLCRLRDRRVRK